MRNLSAIWKSLVKLDLVITAKAGIQDVPVIPRRVRTQKKTVFMRATSWLVLVTFTGLTLEPLSVAAQVSKGQILQSAKPSTQKGLADASAPKKEKTRAEQFSHRLNDIHEILKELVPEMAMPQHLKTTASGSGATKQVTAMKSLQGMNAMPPKTVDAKVKAIRDHVTALEDLESDVVKQFAETERYIKDRNLPAEILQRHYDAVAQYKARATEFRGLTADLEHAVSGSAVSSSDDLQKSLSALGEFMAKFPNAKKYKAIDPSNMPWVGPRPVQRKPFTTAKSFQALFNSEGVKIAQAGSLSGISLPNTLLPNNPQPADLSATEDVQLTQPIVDLAASLNNNPVQIYSWVRNNIEFIPTYGSIQGSDMTLKTRRGNAFDTASLLIAILRAANIPARYVYGTIEIPTSRLMNWVGGVSVPEAAMSLMGQGGIPNVGIGQGGVVTTVQMEHIWVEALVDYTPSRGAKNRTANNWAPMDASYKQYSYVQGMNVLSTVPFDAEGLTNQIVAGATIDTNTGAVQNVSQTLIQNTLSSYQNNFATYINGQKPNATIGDVLGKKTSIQRTSLLLEGSLPYSVIVTAARMQGLPNNLRWAFEYRVYASERDRGNDSPFIDYVSSLPNLAGKKITLSFNPATQADADLILNFVPRPHSDGTPIQQGEVPTALPGYLIKLTPVLRVDGQVVATGAAFTMGSELIQNAGTFNPGQGWLFAADNMPIVGEYYATAIDGQGMGQNASQVLTSRLTATQSRLQQFQNNMNDPSPLTGLTNEDLVGDFLYTGVLSYFAAIDVLGEMTGRQANIRTVRMPSFGNFGMVTQVQYLFGVPRAVSLPSFQLDIDRIVDSEVANDGSTLAIISFRRAIGEAFSAYEHVVPQQLFARPNDPNPPQAFSAVRVISIAIAQGQPVYGLTNANQATHAQTLTQLGIAQSVKQELSDAIDSGLEVWIHQSAISQNGFTGSGYIIIDPATGAGAYKISTGANGGVITIDISSNALFLFAFLLICLSVIVPVLAIFTGGLALAPIVALTFAILNAGLFVLHTKKADDDATFNQVAAAASLEAGLGLITGGLGKILSGTGVAAVKAELASVFGSIMCIVTALVSI